MQKRTMLVAGIAAAALAIGAPVVALAVSGADDPGSSVPAPPSDDLVTIPALSGTSFPPPSVAPPPPSESLVTIPGLPPSDLPAEPTPNPPSDVAPPAPPSDAPAPSGPSDTPAPTPPPGPGR